MRSTTDKRSSGVCHWLIGGGEMGCRIRAYDWSKSPLGPIEGWPANVRTIVQQCVATNFPMAITLGPEHVMLYNDSYRPLCGSKHPAALGADYSECWASAWPDIGDSFARALAGTAIYLDDQRIFLDRYGHMEETFFAFSFSPILDERGQVGGVIVPCIETTDRVLGGRRTRAVRDLAARTAGAQTMEDVLLAAAAALGAYEFDVPFVLAYMVGKDDVARLVASGGIAAGTAASPAIAPIAAPGGVWPLAEVVRTGKPVEVGELAAACGPGCGPYPEPPRRAVALPLMLPGHDRPAAIVILGVSPRLAWNEAYSDFYGLLAGAVTVALAGAHAFAEERRRAEALAELDRAKTAFFSNISHEFRTPLTLMLGPLEEALADGDAPLPERQRERLAVAHCNCLRLSKLVNALLEFSRIEAGRVEVSYQPTDLARFTADLASHFRSACEKAGLTLKLDCPPLADPVYVDRGMWEAIVLNLVSNAFKYTLTGEIEVALRRRGAVVELVVRDSGVGIPPEQLPRLFERFYRVEGTGGRSLEGSGIGLALVRELVRLHGGEVRADSRVGVGSEFTVTIPLGHAHLPADRLRPAAPAPAAFGAAPYVGDALRWVPEPCARRLAAAGAEPPRPPGARPRILLADDNADMRDYVRRLLAARYDVVAVDNGAEALARARSDPPDLILADVMMPRLDGFGLLEAIRSDPRTLEVPVLLVSARAGEEARVQGMRAGADDYLTKPFSARELLARVDAHLALARLRHEAGDSLRASEQRFQAFMDNTPAVAFIKDEEGRYLFVNRELVERFHRDDWIGRTDHEMFPTDLADALRRNDQLVLAQRRPARVVETVTIDGEPRTYLSLKFPLPERGGRWLLAGIAMDITEQKHAEAALEAANRSKDEFLAMLSHELRNPLAPLRSVADSLRGNDLAGPARARAYAIIDRQVTHLTRLVDDLLDVSRITRGKTELRQQVVDLAQIVEQALEMARPALDERHHTVAVTLPTQPLQVQGDPVRLTQVVFNLLGNAAKYTEPHGHIWLTAAREGDEAVVRVRDDGIGMPPELVPRVFDLFAQGDRSLDRSQGGLGLGLTLVHRLVEMHGGSVGASSPGRGQGSEFVVRLPVLAGPPATVPAAPPARAVPARPAARILVVDDNRDVAESLLLLLEAHGAAVRVAHAGADALAVAREFLPQVVLLDIGLPDMDGYEVARRLRHEPGLGRVLVIAVTGYGQDDARRRSEEAGFDYHLVKPVTEETLDAALRQLAPAA
ncbi:PAS domain S-box-containing protein [Nannocystis exedens]|uniref:histidine kinase n=1 Tax=Nannocystis exedens TaxID=54 RepID=A0A1I2GLE3_9BACT|nr:ATP-binding protein [Nannocystis exedens]PCC73644.1 signal transduction histidine kinase [Nannocystis exedens]SFF18292.1 PAS domain S-box-containing protein [Nannocystis exedens]